MGHLVEPSVDVVRDLLLQLRPDLAGDSIVIMPAMAVRPAWCRATCRIGDDHILKFCWSTEAEAPLARQAQLLVLLDGLDPRLPTPAPLAISSDPVALLYRRIDGGPLTYDAVGALPRHDRLTLADDIAEALAAMHSPDVAVACQRAGIDVAPPHPQASTDVLRQRLTPLLDPGLATWLGTCLDDVEAALQPDRETRDPVVLHGDLHGYNLVVDDRWRLRGVLDLEEASLGPLEYDFRYLPRQAPTLDLFDEVRAGYAAHTGRVVDRRRALAWHVLTDLGDALWRTESGVDVVAGPIERRTADLRTLLHAAHW